ncbi:Transcriptional regulator MNL1 [Candida viswanathii]|uniref:Transcriptional regulator MNL1 n=1 Tax=Candida viswanathii TaxID=5486 RepID=A0A367YCN9_9ASCO|nr:Transcriptional regulator MNL1 [Candida viswanathii]
MTSNNDIDQFESEILQEFLNSIQPQTRPQQLRNTYQNQQNFSTEIDNSNTQEYANLYPQFNMDSAQQTYDTNYKTNNELAGLASPLNLDLDFDMQTQQQQQLLLHQATAPQQQPQQYLDDLSGLQSSQPQPNSHTGAAMSGTYRQAFSEDQMEIDDSPPFTIELDLYFDNQQVDNNSIVTSGQLHNGLDVDSLINNQLSIPSQYQQPQHQHLLLLQQFLNLQPPQLEDFKKTPNMAQDSNFSPFDDTSRVSSFANINNASAGLFINGRDIYFDDDSRHRVGRLRNGSIDSYYAANVINHQLHLLQQQQQQQSHSQQPLQDFSSQMSLQNNKSSAMPNELSPLTTTTSRASSIQSGQPSFFSAQQYFSRNSMDQVPSSLHRPSVDMYSGHRPSMESLHSQQQQQRNARYISFTNSISNILPFMGEKNNNNNNNQRSPPSPPATSSSPQDLVAHNQSRHLIRSIFKSNPPVAANNPDTTVTTTNEDADEANNESTNIAEQAEVTMSNDLGEDTFMNGTTANDPEFILTASPSKEEANEEEAVPPKKAKKPKRSIFTRFKTAPVKSDTQEQPLAEGNAVMAPPSLLEDQKLEDVITDVSGNVSTHHSSGTPSIMTNGGVPGASGGVTLEQSVSESSAHQEPDYAALFENVGKRKNKSYRKPKGKTKEEEAQPQQAVGVASSNNSSSTVEKSSFFGKTKSKQEPGSEKSSLMDNASSTNVSLSSSNASSSIHRTSHELEQQNSTAPSTPATSTLANASKRILGSKLILKKKSTSKLKDYTPEELEAMCTVASLDKPVASMISKGVEVEVDLASLDLPPDTKIFPISIVNNKNRTRGRKENREADLSDTSKIYLCNLCQRRFKRHEHLKRHFRSLHTFEKPYNCSICNKKFSRSDNLNQHLKIHKQEEEEAEAEAKAAQANAMET